MRVRVSGKQVQIGETLPVGVRTRLEDVVGKHFDGGAEANVVFSYNGPFYRADCTLHLDSHTVFKSEGEGQDARQAFNLDTGNLQLLCDDCNLAKGSKTMEGKVTTYVATVGALFTGPDGKR